MTRRYQLAVICMLALAGTADATESCMFINFPKFDPDQAQRCVHELKEQLDRERTIRAIEVELLRFEICDLAVEIVTLRTGVDDFIKRTCVPMWEEKRRRNNKARQVPTPAPRPKPQ